MRALTAIVVSLMLFDAVPAAAQFDRDRAAEKAAVPTTTHPYAGIWKEKCADPFGLAIAPADRLAYSVSFCGPGGCFSPGTYRPNTKLVGDPDYRVIDNNSIEVRTAEGFTKYVRCAKR